MPLWTGLAAHDGLRLDLYIAENLGLLSRSQFKARGLKARVNGKEVKPSRIVKTGDKLELSWNDAPSPELLAEDLPLEVIYEDSRVIVINKPQGMVVHPGAGNFHGTLANALLFRRMQRHIQSTAPGEDSLRPGIVHRLDKDTSGVLIAAWDDATLAYLGNQFKEHTVRKTYAAIVQGEPAQKEGHIETRICRDIHNRKLFSVAAPDSGRGKTALTLYRVLWTRQLGTGRGASRYSFLVLRPRTGRTHQLRVHLKYLGCPILGDPLYGKADKHFPDASLMLHAAVLAINIPCSIPGHPLIKSERRIFRAPLPQRFKTLNACLKET
jgi:23S rRNA pseudouridine1911/1915/1917 synthase